MPNPVNRTQTPVIPVGTGQVAGYVGTSAIADPGALLPAQSFTDDVMELQGAGAPVDGTSGTGAGQAGKGSRYINITTGDWYLNAGAGTKASPVWKLVTRAA
jgi:hypothetical protein